MVLNIKKYSHSDIVSIAKDWLLKKCDFVLTEVGTKINGEIPDVIGWIDKDNTVLIEAKKSLSDYIVDSKKPFRKNPEFGMGNFRYYITHHNVIEKPTNGWGLLMIQKNNIEIISESIYFVSNKEAELSLLKRFKKVA